MMGNGSPAAVLSCIGSNATGRVLCSSGTMLCASKDMEEPESSIISTLLPPTIPVIIAVCNLVVVTVIVCWRLLTAGDTCCPSQASLCRFPASSGELCDPTSHIQTPAVSTAIWTIMLEMTQLMAGKTVTWSYWFLLLCCKSSNLLR